MAAPDREGGGAAAVVLKAPAKLTWRLRIVGRRHDGYHLLAAEMVTVDLFDELEFSAGDALEVIDDVDWLGRSDGPAPPVSWNVAGAGPNLVELALAAVGRTASVRLTKRIPAGAGLGGGSSDAAAVLRWAGSSDVGLAAGLGADVPFCLAGGRALVSGIGELVEPLAHQAADLLLVVPSVHVSTPAVFAAWDSLGGPIGDLENDLEPAALVVEPRLAWWRDLISDVSGRRPRLAGSGGTWWLAGDAAALAELQRAVSDGVAVAGESALVKVVKTVPVAEAT
jgi:4-diphosphocytidyl-2-C-methyl-D-erythritol kinase